MTPAPQPAGPVPEQRRPDNVVHLNLQLRYEAPPGCVSSVTLCARTGLTYRQLDYWTRTRLLTPVGPADPGPSRYFPLDQVHRAATLKWLLDAGISLQTCRAVIDELLETGTAHLNPTLTVHLPEDY